MIKLLFISVLFFITVSFAKRDPEEIIRDLDARLEAIDKLVGHQGSFDMSTCPLADSNTLGNESACDLAESSENDNFYSCNESDSETVDTPVETQVTEAPMQKGWFSGIKSFFGY